MPHDTLSQTQQNPTEKLIEIKLLDELKMHSISQ